MHKLDFRVRDVRKHLFKSIWDLRFFRDLDYSRFTFFYWLFLNHATTLLWRSRNVLWATKLHLTSPRHRVCYNWDFIFGWTVPLTHLRRRDNEGLAAYPQHVQWTCRQLCSWPDRTLCIWWCWLPLWIRFPAPGRLISNCRQTVEAERLIQFILNRKRK